MLSCQHSVLAQSLLPVCRASPATAFTAQVFPQLFPETSPPSVSITPTGFQSKFLISFCPFLISHWPLLIIGACCLLHKKEDLCCHCEPLLDYEDSPRWWVGTLPLVRNVIKWPSGDPHFKDGVSLPVWKFLATVHVLHYIIGQLSVQPQLNFNFKLFC